MINITDSNIETNDNTEIDLIPSTLSDSGIESEHSPHNIKELLPAYLTKENYNVINTGNTHIFYTGTKGKIGGTNII